MPFAMRLGMQSVPPGGPSDGCRVISADEVRRALPVTAVIDALQVAFRAKPAVTAPPRTQLPWADGTLLVMPAAGTLVGGSLRAGTKVVTVRAANTEQGVPSVQAVYLMFGGDTLAPLAVLDGPALTDLRTSAVSALAARLLARPEARTLVLFGAGAQARAHLVALSAVRPVAEVVVVGRDPARASGLVSEARSRGLSARLGTADAVADADLVCTCTTSREPLFDGKLLRPGTHVTAVGAYQPHARELDDATICRGRLVVEDREAALAEAGDLAMPMAAGLIDPSAVVADLVELCAGARVRQSPEDVTVFKSVGLAVEDLVVADAVLRSLE